MKKLLDSFRLMILGSLIVGLGVALVFPVAIAGSAAVVAPGAADVLGFEVWLILAARLVPGIALILCGRVLFSRGKIDYLSDAQK